MSPVSKNVKPCLNFSIVSIATGLNGSASGTVNLKGAALFGGITGDSVLVLLNAGKLYINVHTAANPGGEIRAQLAKQ